MAQTITISKRTQSMFWLIMTIFIIFSINAALPLMEAGTHYTTSAISMTYKEYKDLFEENQAYDMDWNSKMSVEIYKVLYQNTYTDLTPEEIVSIQPPDNFEVSVYTKYFFEDWFWYLSSFMSITSAVVLFYALFNYMITIEKSKRLEYINIENQVNQVNNQYIEPIFFEPWIDEDFNYKRKVSQHITNIKYEITVLQNGIKSFWFWNRRKPTDIKIINKFKTYFANYGKESVDPLAPNLPVIYVEMSKEEKRYVDKMERLHEQLQPDFIKEHIMGINVKYFKYIKPGFIYSGENIDSPTTDQYSNIKTDGERITRDSGKKVLTAITMTLAFAIILTLVIVDANNKPLFWVIIGALAKMAPLILQIKFSIDYKNTFMDEQLIPNLKLRKSIQLQFLQHQKEIGKGPSFITLQNVVEEKANGKE